MNLPPTTTHLVGSRVWSFNRPLRRESSIKCPSLYTYTLYLHHVHFSSASLMHRCKMKCGPPCSSLSNYSSFRASCMSAMAPLHDKACHLLVERSGGRQPSGTRVTLSRRGQCNCQHHFAVPARLRSEIFPEAVRFQAESKSSRPDWSRPQVRDSHHLGTA